MVFSALSFESFREGGKKEGATVSDGLRCEVNFLLL